MEAALDSFLHVVNELLPDQFEELSQKLHRRFQSPPTVLVAQALSLESLTDAEVSRSSLPRERNCLGGLISRWTNAVFTVAACQQFC